MLLYDPEVELGMFPLSQDNWEIIHDETGKKWVELELVITTQH